MSLKLKTKLVKKPKIQKFLRLPVDEKTDKLIQDIIDENPFFTPLDAIRFILGKHIRQSSRQKMRQWLKINVGDKNLTEMDENQIFKFLEENQLDR
jgi:hypothetical protein